MRLFSRVSESQIRKSELPRGFALPPRVDSSLLSSLPAVPQVVFFARPRDIGYVVLWRAKLNLACRTRGEERAEEIQMRCLW